MIQILEIKKLNSGSLRAFVKVQINDLIFHDFRIIQQPGQRAWVNVPQTNWKDSTGKTHYKNMVELPDTLKDEVFKKILTEWNSN